MFRESIDVTLAGDDDRIFGAHKIVLNPVCPFFRNIYQKTSSWPVSLNSSVGSLSKHQDFYIQIFSFIFNFLGLTFSKLLCFCSFRLYRCSLSNCLGFLLKTPGFQYFANELGCESLYLLKSKIKGSKTNTANNRVHCLKS